MTVWLWLIISCVSISNILFNLFTFSFLVNVIRLIFHHFTFPLFHCFTILLFLSLHPLFFDFNISTLSDSSCTVSVRKKLQRSAERTECCWCFTGIAKNEIWYAGSMIPMLQSSFSFLQFFLVSFFCFFFVLIHYLRIASQACPFFFKFLFAIHTMPCHPMPW